MIDTALSMGIAPRAEISSPDEAQEYLDMGVKHFCIGTDVGILFQWFQQNGKAMREALGTTDSRTAAEQSATSYKS
ncbi:MAG: hypothetical protein VB876_00345 [Pirellulales bacterium]